MKTEPDDRAFPMVVEGLGSNGGLTKRELFAVLVYAGHQGLTHREAVESADLLIKALNHESKD